MSSPIHTDRRAFVRTALATLGAVAMSDSNAGFFDKMLETKPPYPVKSSRLVMANKIGFEPILWLDNERVLIPGGTVERHTEPDGKEVLSGQPFGLYIWNVKRNTYTRYADLDKSGRWLLQYDHGNIAYSLESDNHGITIAMIGKMGKEKRMTLDRGKGGVLPELEPSRGPGMRFRHEGGVSTMIYVLRPEHDYIVVGSGDALRPGNPNDHLKLYRSDQSEPIELPVLVKEMYSGAKFSYSDYLGKYVLIPSTWRGRDLANGDNAWPKDQPYPIYLISSEGKVDTIEIPPGLWYPQAVFPTQQGLFWVSNNTRGNSRDAGGWLLKDGKVTKLFDQLVDGAGVSPDGCTIVYANNDFNPKTTEYVQAIDLCASQNKK